MSIPWKIGGSLLAACVACCAASVILPLLGFTGFIALGPASWGLSVAITIAGLLIVRKALRASAHPSAGALIGAARARGCGCRSLASPETPIACMLDTGDFKERAAEIRALTDWALLHAERGPLTLKLSYRGEAAAEVKTLIAKEQQCCPFLTFSMKQTEISIEVTITAPPAARAAADALFGHFVSEHMATNDEEAT